MSARPDPQLDHEMENRVSSWLTDTDLSPDEATAGLDRLLHEFPVAPQARRRFLGRWLDRDEGAGRRTADHDPPPGNNRRSRLMLSATGITTALAVLVLAVNVSTDTEPPSTGAEAGTDHYVVADGSGDYESIQAAVDAAEDGDSVLIASGTYTESVLVDKDLVIAGLGGSPATVIVHIPDDGPTGLFKGMSLQYGFWFEDADAEIANLTIKGPAASVSALVAMGGELFAHGIVEDLDPYTYWPYGFLYMDGDATGVIHGNTSKAFVWIDGEATPTVRENTIHNVIRNDGDSAAYIHDNDLGGIWSRGTSTPRIENNRIDYANNGGADGGFSICGIEVNEPQTRPTIIGNTILNATTGICVAGATPVEISGNSLADNDTAITLSKTEASATGNDISGEGHGISVNVTGSPMVSGNTIDVGRNGIVVSKGASPLVEGNTVCGGENTLLVAEGSEAVVRDNDVC